MKRILLCAAAMTTLAGVAHGDDLSDVRDASARLKRENQALVKRIADLEIRQKRIEQQRRETPSPLPPAIAAQTGWTAADLGHHIPEAILNGDGPITFHGITLYGGVDIGVAYQAHGVPLNPYWASGLEYVISKNSNHSILSVAPNSLSTSNVGVKGVEEIVPGLSAIFNAQVGFDPQAGVIPDGLKTLAQQNGVALDRQATGGDSTRSGQVFQQVYAGLNSPKFGTLTFGRQNTLTLDGILAYDPMGGSPAFSVIGYLGAAAGGGTTETTRLDNTLKYRVTYGPVHAGALYKFGQSGSANGNAYQGQVGFEQAGFSFDAIGSHVSNGINASALSAAQVAGLTAPVYATAPGAGVVNATVSDNTTFLLLTSYTSGQFRVFAGYENIRYQNPAIPISSTLASPSYTGGIYLLNPEAGAINNAAYNHNKVLQTFWTGLKYAARPNLDLTVAYYHQEQNSYSGATNLDTYGCTTSIASNCKGSLNAGSALVDYRLTKRFDVYAGALYSTVADGLSSGYLHRWTINPAVGGRYQF